MVSDLNIFFGSGLKSPKKEEKKKDLLCLKNMVEITLPVGLETSGQRYIANFVIFLDVFEFLQFG